MTDDKDTLTRTLDSIKRVTNGEKIRLWGHGHCDYMQINLERDSEIIAFENRYPDYLVEVIFIPQVSIINVLTSIHRTTTSERIKIWPETFDNHMQINVDYDNELQEFEKKYPNYTVTITFTPKEGE